MIPAERAARFAPPRCPRLVVKIGSALLVGPDGTPRRDWLGTLLDDVVVVVVVLVEVVVPGDPVKVDAEAEDRPPGEKLLLPVPVLVLVALGVVCVWAWL